MSNVYLHPTKENDFNDYYEVRSDPSDIYWNGYTKAPDRDTFFVGFLKRTSDARFSEPEDRRNYLVKMIVSDKTVGFLQIIRKVDRIEIGYSILQKYQRKGYASEALMLGKELTKNYGLPLSLNIRDDNIASQKVAKKNGFVATNIYQEIVYPIAGRIKLRRYILGE